MKIEYDGYVAKDQDGSVHLFLQKEPWREESEVGQGQWTNDMWDGMTLDRSDFINLSWKDEKATKVKVKIEAEFGQYAENQLTWTDIVY